MYNPLVSIVIPVYNGANFMAQAIDSALAQTYKNVEIIVVNDGSKDEGATEKIALSYGEKIKYVFKPNGGIASALNAGIANMAGEWFSWLSHDDMYTPDKIEKQIARLNDEIEQSQIDVSKAIVFGNAQFIDKDSKPIKRVKQYFKKTQKIQQTHYSGLDMLQRMFLGHSISGCTLLINRDFFNTVGVFNTELGYLQDIDMWYRIMLTDCHFYYMKEKSVLSRVHSAQTTVTGKAMRKKDAVIVGRWLLSQLIGKYHNGEYLLLMYYYVTLLSNNSEISEQVKKELKKENKYTFRVSIKAGIKRGYGKLRPKLIHIYYKIAFGVRRKK